MKQTKLNTLADCQMEHLQVSKLFDNYMLICFGFENRAFILNNVTCNIILSDNQKLQFI